MRRNANVGCHQVGLQTTDPADAWRCIATIKRTGSAMEVKPSQRERTYAFRRPAMQKGDIRGGDGVVVPRVTTELVKAWSISRH